MKENISKKYIKNHFFENNLNFFITGVTSYCIKQLV